MHCLLIGLQRALVGFGFMQRNATWHLDEMVGVGLVCCSDWNITHCLIWFGYKLVFRYETN